MIVKTLLTASLFFTVVSCAAQSTSTNYTSIKTGILTLVNKHRAGMGLKPLKMNEAIEKAAEQHSRNMATQKIPFGHDGFDERMKNISQQLGGATGWAENVALGAETAERAVDMWLHSPGHKKNIEGKYSFTGIGIVKGADGQLYYTQIFVEKGN